MLTVLIVDDVEDNLQALRELLERDDLQILLARSGKEALEQLASHDVALALLDVQMPGMDGITLAERMRSNARTREVPIVFLTADSRDTQRVFSGYEHASVDYLYKPIDTNLLRHKVTMHCGFHALKSELASLLVEHEALIDELAEVRRLADEFASAVNHDLRNPLGVITLSAELLLIESNDERVKKLGTRMLSNGQRLTTMIDEMVTAQRARLLQKK